MAGLGWSGFTNLGEDYTAFAVVGETLRRL